MTETKACQNCKQNFTIDAADFDFYQKITVPAPTFCPDCRLQRRMTYRNERTLYKDICDLCKKPMLSMYSPDKPYTVYCKDCWYGDGWDAFQYGREYDFSRNFFEQFQDLLKVVPRLNLMYIQQNTGCEFANFVANVKNAYLSYSIVVGENIYYCRSVDASRDAFDSLNSKELERCYENIDSAHNYESLYMIRSRDCVGSKFLFDCVNCQSCFMSSNLRSRQYVFRNQQLTKEQYEAELAKVKFGSIAEIRQLRAEFKKLVGSSLHKFANALKAVASTGDNISNVKNAIHVFDCYDSENVRYCLRMFKGVESYDVIGSAGGQYLYETVGVGLASQNSKFDMYGDAMQNVEYSDWCPLSANLIGCSALRKKSYCIFNKQYSKEEYQVLTAKITEQMKNVAYTDKAGRIYKYGEFFPIEMGTFAYNETLAQEYFPLTKEQAIGQGFSWRDPEPPTYKATTTSAQLPDNIADVKDEILKEIIECGNCRRAYRVVPAEIAFLRTMKLSLPEHCPECRYQARFAVRTPLKLWTRKCMKPGCVNEFQTSYSPERPERVYCESCYQAEVV